MTSASDYPRTIKKLKHRGMIVDVPAFNRTIAEKEHEGCTASPTILEEVINSRLAQRERELTSRRGSVKATVTRLAEKALAVGRLAKTKLLAALKR
ncbi:uncharacterized protein BKCO1_1400017 [Diplodia corticola]|uniref:Uncharacterized protein n=1 Tax=Diplodia corticola TaxID=236234 RepID=A0A1J9R5T9_9PEZI|nr:uncharacterized protein BKCO1_1400017 [Diplodia corticola]OJD35976.1 hypothetical protein BKCO1_1400017 [Diplodia corticola]